MKKTNNLLIWPVYVNFDLDEWATEEILIIDL